MKRQGSLNLVHSDKVSRAGSFYVAQARIRNMWKWKWSILGASFANPMFYLVSVGIGVGQFINKSSGHGIDGVKYITFLAPALLASTAIQGALDETMFPTLEGFKWAKNFFAMNATPLTGKQIANGVFLGALARTGFGCASYFVVMALFGAVDSWRGVLMIFSTLYAGLAFGALMQGVTASMKNDDLLMNIVQRFLIMPLFLFSGTFYSLKTMPVALQILGWLSPLWHSTEIARWISYGHHISATGLVLHVAYMTLMMAGGLKFAHYHFEKRLSR